MIVRPLSALWLARREGGNFEHSLSQQERPIRLAAGGTSQACKKNKVVKPYTRLQSQSHVKTKNAGIPL